MYPKLLYETLPVFYAVAAWVCMKALPRPYALLPTAAFALAAVLVVIQRWYYRRQFHGPE
ncbi:hypothetical protein [Acidiferrobacter thiooxydans]|uniref:Uncharacterized protein n=1 Tax=Acidiferrobacter thiooxydans TaxID=163359 RepID=A0A1C2FY98_9GAMM|nr:hypothetical protein [Acidiferrobacter thiooxydans]MDA8191619.1 hypothetical protein [Gammaproteobacteria bacterium]RCN56748.1 hypothetical protein C4900_13360 [Acidiferrobacter thiooxydans]UEN99426.1 hypothetical protein A9R16_013505 [Acidiferrobacter thiooxydans]